MMTLRLLETEPDLASPITRDKNLDLGLETHVSRFSVRCIHQPVVACTSRKYKSNNSCTFLIFTSPLNSHLSQASFLVIPLQSA